MRKVNRESFVHNALYRVRKSALCGNTPTTHFPITRTQPTELWGGLVYYKHLFGCSWRNSAREMIESLNEE